MFILRNVGLCKANNFNIQRTLFKLPKTIPTYKKTICKGENANGNIHMKRYLTPLLNKIKSWQ